MMNNEIRDSASAQPSPEVTLADLRQEVRHLIADVGRPIRRVSLRAGDSVIEVEWENDGGGAGTGATDAAPAGVVPAPREVQGPVVEAASHDQHRIVAPLVGTFYGAPSPGAEPFVSVGDVVQPGQQVAIIEAMKLMNSVAADRGGRVVSVEVKDGEMVEFGQALVVLEPVDDAE